MTDRLMIAARLHAALIVADERFRDSPIIVAREALVHADALITIEGAAGATVGHGGSTPPDEVGPARQSAGSTPAAPTSRLPWAVRRKTDSTTLATFESHTDAMNYRHVLPGLHDNYEVVPSQYSLASAEAERARIVALVNRRAATLRDMAQRPGMDQGLADDCRVKADEVEFVGVMIDALTPEGIAAAERASKGPFGNITFMGEAHSPKPGDVERAEGTIRAHTSTAFKRALSGEAIVNALNGAAQVGGLKAKLATAVEKCATCHNLLPVGTPRKDNDPIRWHPHEWDANLRRYGKQCASCHELGITRAALQAANARADAAEAKNVGYRADLATQSAAHDSERAMHKDADTLIANLRAELNTERALRQDLQAANAEALTVMRRWSVNCASVVDGAGALLAALELRTSEVDKLKAKLADTESTLKMYATAWAREIGTPYRSKVHEIDALVLTTRDRIQALKALQEALANARGVLAVSGGRAPPPNYKDLATAAIDKADAALKLVTP